MHRSTWKQGERRVAKILGTKRTALSGGNSGITRSDSRHDKLFVECKHSKSHAVWTLYKKTKLLAKLEKKTPVIALNLLSNPGVIFCIHSADMEAFIKEWLILNPALDTWGLARSHPTHPDHILNRPSSPSLAASIPPRKKRKRKKGKL